MTNSLFLSGKGKSGVVLTVSCWNDFDVPLEVFKVMVRTASFSSCLSACSALCMKYCSVSNYFTRVYAIYIYLFFLFILFTLFFYSYFLFCFFSLSFSFSFSFLFFSFFFLCKSGAIRKLFGLHCFPFNIVSFAYLQCTCLSHKYRFRTFRLRKIALWVQN